MKSPPPVASGLRRERRKRKCKRTRNEIKGGRGIPAGWCRRRDEHGQEHPRTEERQTGPASGGWMAWTAMWRLARQTRPSRVTTVRIGLCTGGRVACLSPMPRRVSQWQPIAPTWQRHRRGVLGRSRMILGGPLEALPSCSVLRRTVQLGHRRSPLGLRGGIVGLTRPDGAAHLRMGSERIKQVSRTDAHEYDNLAPSTDFLHGKSAAACGGFSEA